MASAKPRVPEQYRERQYNLNVGHGASLGSSAYPHLDPRKEKQVDDVLHPNQLISVECFFGEVGSPQAVKLEEMIVIREEGPERIAPMSFDERFVPA